MLYILFNFLLLSSVIFGNFNSQLELSLKTVEQAIYSSSDERNLKSPSYDLPDLFRVTIWSNERSGFHIRVKSSTQYEQSNTGLIHQFVSTKGRHVPYRVYVNLPESNILAAIENAYPANPNDLGGSCKTGQTSNGSNGAIGNGDVVFQANELIKSTFIYPETPGSPYLDTSPVLSSFILGICLNNDDLGYLVYDSSESFDTGETVTIEFHKSGE